MKHEIVLLAALAAIPLNACASLQLPGRQQVLELAPLPTPPPVLIPQSCLRQPEQAQGLTPRPEYPTDPFDRYDAVIDDLSRHTITLEGVNEREAEATRVCANGLRGQGAQ